MAAYHSLEEALKLETSRRRYEDFSTIDWVHHFNRSRALRAKLARASSPRRTFEFFFNIVNSWGAVTAIGVLIGLTAAAVGLCTEILSDWRYGMCSKSVFYPKHWCCAIDSIKDGLCEDWHEWSYRFTPFRTFPLINFVPYVLLAVLYAYFSSTFVLNFAPEFSPFSGIPELKAMLGGFIMKEALSMKTAVIKAISLCFSIASGLTIGQKAPLVHLAACIGNFVKRFSPQHRDDEAASSHLLTCASAAAIAVGFGSPIGGILFALEEVSSYFPVHVIWMSLVCCIAATLTTELIDPLKTGAFVLFRVQEGARTWHVLEVFSFVSLGIFGGILGALFNRWNTRLQVARKSSSLCKDNPIKEAVYLAFATSLICYFSSFSHDKMVSLLAGLYRECEQSNYNGICSSGGSFFFTNLSLLFTGIIRFALFVITFGVRLPSGIYIPCMAVGACLGRFFANIIVLLLRKSYFSGAFSSCVEGKKSCIMPGSYALLGSAAVLTGTTRLTISVSVILFELTGSMDFILPTIITVVVAKFVADFLAGPDGHSNLMIQLHNYPFLENKREIILPMTAERIMTSEQLCTVSNKMTVRELKNLLDSVNFGTFPVVSNDSNCALEGCITRNDLKFGLLLARSNDQIVYFIPPINNNDSHIHDLSSFTDQTPLGVHPLSSMDAVYSLFLSLGLRYVFVKNCGNLLGIITKKDMIRCLNAQQGTFLKMDQEHEQALDIDPVLVQGQQQSKRILRGIVSNIRNRLESTRPPDQTLTSVTSSETVSEL